ncbi:uncharacterized protein L3040_005335 [Drepanopeziza brunnea f. sp. 'multigermtubi']|uniref:uncharacterized protein n=1 Tax=Drepanopeziza brunnea f. sp. 'multigermtubi' TaxID=698441 RepID=UPI0023963E45|nr:hypothetical protein L3040_005335 [Drepanopeziza brunnea f. sp. 'multigermtubi']
MFGEYSVTLLVASVLALASSVLAGFDAASSKNVAVYWGQNSFGQVGSQASLAFYCEDTRIDIIPISFMISLRDRTLNLGPSSPDLEDDIKSCQRLGKTILLSFPGAYYTEGGFDSVEMAIKGAQDVWAAFGPVQAYSTISRPFGSAVVDGFDFDFESSDIGYIVAFGEELDRLRRYPSDKSIILTAAPQCPFPDQAMNGLFEKIPFDALFIQFYNNYCGVKNFNPGADRSSFNFDAWDRWAKQESLNRRVKLLLGAPANVAAAGKGSYVEPYVLAQAIAESQKFESFGGVMFWDMTQLYSNVGFLDIVVGALEGNRFSTPSSEPAPSFTEPAALPTVDAGKPFYPGALEGHWSSTHSSEPAPSSTEPVALPTVDAAEPFYPGALEGNSSSAPSEPAPSSTEPVALPTVDAAEPFYPGALEGNSSSAPSEPAPSSTEPVALPTVDAAEPFYPGALEGNSSSAPSEPAPSSTEPVALPTVDAAEPFYPGALEGNSSSAPSEPAPSSTEPVALPTVDAAEPFYPGALEGHWSSAPSEPAPPSMEPVALPTVDATDPFHPLATTIVASVKGYTTPAPEPTTLIIKVGAPEPSPASQVQAKPVLPALPALPNSPQLGGLGEPSEC